MFVSENEAFLEAMGYDEGDEGVDYEPPPWAPDELAFRRYLERDAKHAIANVAKLAEEGYARHKVVITNGRQPGYGYGAIAVIVGGPEPEDCLHSLSVFGKARTKLAHTLGAHPDVSVPAEHRGKPVAA